MIKRGQTLSISDNTIVEAKSYLGWIKRKYNREDKHKLVIYIEDVIGETIRCLKDYQDKNYLILITNSLNNARGGITNLLSTYSDYTDTISQLKILIRDLDLQLSEHRRYLHGNELVEERRKEDEKKKEEDEKKKEDDERKKEEKRKEEDKPSYAAVAATAVKPPTAKIMKADNTLDIKNHGNEGKNLIIQ
jgi:hypothetical protein